MKLSRLLPPLIAVLIALACIPSAWAQLDEDRTPAATSTKIVFVDVGQGDGVVIKLGGKFIVSDAGLPSKADEMDAVLDDLGANGKIDVAVLSHGHKDHVGGFEPLLETFGYDIDLAIASANVHWSNTVTNRRLLAALDEHDVTLTWVKKGDSFGWGGASWKILGPSPNQFLAASSVENSSVVYLLKTNGRQVLFTGDIKEEASDQLAAGWNEGQVHIFLATHHGSASGSPESLVAEIRPRFAVFSVGNNTFGHPSVEAIVRLQAFASKIWCTDTNGNVTATISTSGAITWSTQLQAGVPWGSRAEGRTGLCVGR